MSRKIILRIMKTTLRIMKTILRIMKTILRIAKNISILYERLCLPGTNVACVRTNFRTRHNPSLVTGLWCKPYTRNQLDYRRLCELVLGWRVFRGKKLRIGRIFLHAATASDGQGWCARLAQTFVFNRRFLAMAEYSSKLELCSFGLTKTFI